MATNFNVPNQDFVGFSFGKWHCIRDGHIYRTSDGSRYNQNLAPAFDDKTQSIPGANGQFYFGTFHKNRSFTINFAFDELSEGHLQNLYNVFDGTSIKNLIFDEHPYKAYDAKVTGTPTIKAICFDINGKRVYKGEGTVQFTCYNPYAHTPDWVWGSNFSAISADGRRASSYNSSVYTTKDQWLEASNLTDSVSTNRGTLPAPFVVKGASGTVTVAGHTITIDGSGTWDSRVGIVMSGGVPVPYVGNASATIPPGSSATTSSGSIDFEYWYY